MNDVEHIILFQLATRSVLASPGVGFLIATLILSVPIFLISIRRPLMRAAGNAIVCAVAILGATSPYLVFVADAVIRKCETAYICFVYPTVPAVMMYFFYPHLFLALVLSVIVLCVPKSWPAKPVVTMVIAGCSIAASLIYVEPKFS